MTTWMHTVGDGLREALLLIPLGVVRVFLVLALLALLLWVLRLPREVTRPPEGEEGGLSGNLKIWAAVALGLQIVIYSLF